MPSTPVSFSSKLPRVGTTIFTVMSSLAKEHEALNLSQGFPEFEAPEKLRKLLSKHAKSGYHQYIPMAGLLTLRNHVAASLEKHGTSYDPEEEITITAGATQAIFTAVMALIKDQDEVIVFTPAYDCYTPAIELAGGSPVHVQLKGDNYEVDWDEVRKVVNRKTKMILINSPHNPTGSCLSASDIEELEKIVDGTDIIVLSDEVYEHMVFDREKHHSCASRSVLAQQSLIVGSFGKTYHVTGWKIGYIAGPGAIMAEFRKVHQYNVFCVNGPAQFALASYMESCPEHPQELSAFYQQKRDLFLSELDGSRFSFHPTQGTYFQLLNFSTITDKPDTDVAVAWTKKPGIASIPVSVFYHQPIHNHVLRFCFAKHDETLVKAAQILKTL